MHAKMLFYEFGASVDWILNGVGSAEPLPESSRKPTVIDKSILIDSIEALEETLKINNRVMLPKKKAEIIAEIYMYHIENEREVAKEMIDNLLRLAV